MNEQKWTKEPWFVFRDAGRSDMCNYITDKEEYDWPPDDEQFVEVMGREPTRSDWPIAELGFKGECWEIDDNNADRIVACVNACAGIENPAAELAALKAENERLKGLVDEFNLFKENKPLTDCIKQLKAINKEIADVLIKLVSDIDAWNNSISAIIKRKPQTWINLDKARQLCEKIRGGK